MSITALRSERIKSHGCTYGECGIILFAAIGALFAVFKRKAANYVSGFHSLPKEKRASYDKAYISHDMRNQCFVWTAVMSIGAVLSYTLTPHMAILAFALWLILFFKNVYLDVDKAFEKYLLK